MGNNKKAKPLTSIQLTKETQELLSSLMHHKQTYEEFILALLDKVDTHDGIIISGTTAQRLERYRNNPKDTVDDLVKTALNENQEFEKQLIRKE